MLKSLRRTYWLISEFTRRHLRIITRTATAVLVIFSLIAIFARYLPTPRLTTRVAMIGKFTQETIPLPIQKQVSRGLVEIVSDQVKPALADSWQVEDDGKKYRFNLSPDLRWSDGTTLKPADINYNFKDVQVSYQDNSVTYTLENPYSPFFSVVTKPIIKDNRFGVNEFIISKIDASGGLLQQMTVLSSKEKYIYKFYPTESAALTAYKLGEVDKIQNISTIPQDFQDENNLISDNQDNKKIAVVFFNNRDTVLSSKSTRQALSYAIKDKNFGRTRAISPILPDSWAFNQLIKEYDYDPEKAKTLFSLDVKNPAEIKIDLKTTLQYLDFAEQIAADWRETLGIQVDVKVVTTIQSDYQTLLADYSPPLDPDQYTMWHSTQPGNFTHYTNLKVDKLLEDGRRTSDNKLRKEIYQDFQRFLLEDCPAVFLFNTNSFDLSRKPLFR